MGCDCHSRRPKQLLERRQRGRQDARRSLHQIQRDQCVSAGKWEHGLKDSSLAEPESRVVCDNTRTSNRQNRTISLTYIPATSGSLKSSDLCPSLVLLDFLSKGVV